MPTHPGFEVEALREMPEIIAEASVPATVENLSGMIERLDRQILVHNGLGAAAVLIDSAPPKASW